ncbi:MAG TPA: 50S ribosomal protein L23 [Limnochordia bacterium]|nr:50S ribosomal protein L23 [Limnochordia bacterium]
MDARDVLVRPLITEKSMDAMSDNKYTFEVALGANRTQIKQAVEQIFNVRVLKVNTVRRPGKLKRMGKFQGRRPERKRAVVTLAQGQRIEVFEGL